MAHIDINQDLGPQFVVTAPAEQLTLEVGVKSSSLFSLVVNNPSSAEGIEVMLKADIGQYRAITHSGFTCNSSINDLGNYAGVTTVAGITNENITVVRVGRLAEAGWTWTPNMPIFISDNGILTQTPPSLPMRRIGWAINATQINLDPFPIIGV